MDKNTKYEVVIVGAGMAGLTAAIYACRAGRSVLVLENMAYGGQIMMTSDIENWPGFERISGTELMKGVYDQARKLGAVMESGMVEAISKQDNGFIVKTDEDDYLADSVILAVGVGDKKLELTQEAALVGKGVSYCATCDGAFYKGKPVAVVGGGNSALYEALYLADLAEKVYIIHRREQLRGDSALIEKLKKKRNVEFLLEYTVQDILGIDKVTGVKIKNKQGIITEMVVDAVFVAIGKTPLTSNFTDLVELDKDGYIRAGEDCLTSCPGVFVAGDCRTKTVRQLVTAAADGAVSAKNASLYLQG